MTDYIHSGVHSKMNKIVNPHPGSVLVSNKLGHAEESDKVISDFSSIERRITTIEEQVNNLSGSNLTGAYIYRGTVDTPSDLPTGAEVGDVYNVTSSGANWAWNGTIWDELGSNDENLVHRTSNETIAGTKTFTTTVVADITGEAGRLNWYNLYNVPDSFTPESHDHNDLVHIEGSETITGNKTFTNIVVADITGEAGRLDWNNLYNVPTLFTPNEHDHNDLVHLAGTETITGNKTFTNTIIADISGEAGRLDWNNLYNVPEFFTPETHDHSDLVHIAGAETITGAKTFSTIITADITGEAGRLNWNNLYNVPDFFTPAEHDHNDLVHKVGNETISDTKTFTGRVHTKSLTGTTVSSTGGTIVVSSGSVFNVNIAVNTNITFTSVPEGCNCISLIITNGGNYTVTWPNTVKWEDDTTPELTKDGMDVVTLLTPNAGTDWYGVVSLAGIGTGGSGSSGGNDPGNVSANTISDTDWSALWQ